MGISIGTLPTGKKNSITDVDGVRVGHTTLISGDGPLQPGHGPVRTGVTVIRPHGADLFRQKVAGAVHTINGFGKPFGFEQVRELGLIESPIALTNTLNVGLVADALVQYSVRDNPDIGISTTSVNVLVGETNDGFLNDMQGRHVRAEHVWAAIETAEAGVVPEGSVGAGTGTVCFGWKGGIGTSSRVIPGGATEMIVGALVQSNFGSAEDLIVDGIPVGRHLQPAQAGHSRGSAGSIMIVLATNTPLTSPQLLRLCVRAGAGLARTGSVYGHGSGDFVIAFSTAERYEHHGSPRPFTRKVMTDERRVLDWLFLAAAECVEEAILNSLCRAETMVGRDGHTAHGLPLDQVAAIVRARQGNIL